jgi:tape measure domain-containing protein
MASKAAIATAWIRVLPSLDGLQAALVQASKGALLTPKVMPKLDSSLFAKSGANAGGIFAGLFNSSSSKTVNSGLGGLLSELEGNFSKSGSRAGAGFSNSFGSYLSGGGLSGYLKLGLAASGVAAVGSAAASIIGTVAGLGNEWGRVNGMVRNAIGDQGDLQGALKMTTSAANEIGVPMKELATESARLVKLAPNTIPDYGTAVKFTSLLSKNMVATGASTEEVNSVMRQVTQSLGKGVVNGDELNSIMENAPEIAQILADHLGVSVGQLKEMGKEGKISGDALRDSILGAEKRINDEFMKMPVTADRAWKMVANDFSLQMEAAYVQSSVALGDSIKKLSTSGLVESFAKYLSKNMGAAFDDIAKMADHLVDMFTPLKGVFDDASEGVSPFIQALNSITGAFVSMNLNDFINNLKLIATVGTFAFSGILGGVDNMLSRIPLVGNTLLGLKKSAGTVGAALGSMAGAGVDATGKLMDKLGDATSGMSKLFNGFGQNSKQAKEFEAAIKDMDFSSMPKKFQDALKQMTDGTQPFDKSLAHMETVLNNLSTNALSNLPRNFSEVMAKAGDAVESESNDILAKTSSLASKISITFKGMFEAGQASKQLQSAMQSISSTVDAVSNNASTAFRDGALHFTSAITKGASASFKETGASLAESLAGAFANLNAKIDPQIVNIGVESRKAADEFQKNWDSIATSSKSTFDKILAYSEMADKASAEGWITFTDSFHDVMNDAIDKAYDASLKIEDGLGKIPSKVKTAYADISSIIDASYATTMSNQSKYTKEEMNNVANARNVIVKSFTSLTGIKVPDFLTPAVGSMISATTNELRRLSTVVTAPMNALVNLSDMIGEKMGRALGGPPVQMLKSAFSDALVQARSEVPAIEKIFSGIGAAASKAMSFRPSFDGAIKAVNSFGTEFSDVLFQTMDIPPSITDKIGKGVAAALRTPISTVRSGVEVIGQTVSGAVKHFGGLGTVAQKTFSSIMSGALKVSGGALKGIGTALSGVSKGFSAVGRAAANLGVTTAITSSLGTAITQLYHADPSEMGQQMQDMANKMSAGMATAAKQVPAMATAFQNVLPQVIGMFTTMVPQLIPVVVSTINTLVTTITDNLPQIMAAVQIALNAIIASIPQILPALLNGVMSLIGSVAQMLPSMLATLGNAVIALIGALGPVIQTGVPIMMAAISSMMTQIGTQLPVFAQQLAASLPAFMDAIAAALPQTLTSLMTGISALVTGIIQMLPTLLPTLIMGFVSLINGLIGALPQIIMIFAQMLPQIIDGVTATIGTVIPALVQGAISMVNALVQNLPTIIQALVTAAPMIIQSLVTGFVSNIGVLINGAIQLVLALVAALPQIIIALIEAIPTILSTLGQAFIDNFPTILAAFGNGFVSLAAALPQLIGTVIGAIPGILLAIARAFEGLGGKILGFIKDIPDKIKGLFDGAGQWLLDAGKSIMDGLVKGLKNAWHGVTDFVGGIGDWIKEHKGPISYDRVLLIPAGLAIMGGFHKALVEGFGDVQEFVESVAPQIQNMVSAGIDPLYANTDKFPNANMNVGANKYNGDRPTVINVKADIVRGDDDLYTAVPQTVRALQNEFQGSLVI